jgi:hypothetical protein
LLTIWNYTVLLLMFFKVELLMFCNVQITNFTHMDKYEIYNNYIYTIM